MVILKIITLNNKSYNLKLRSNYLTGSQDCFKKVLTQSQNLGTS